MIDDDHDDCSLCRPPEGVQVSDVARSITVDLVEDLKDHGLGMTGAFDAVLGALVEVYGPTDILRALFRLLDADAPRLQATFESMGLREVVERLARQQEDRDRAGVIRRGLGDLPGS